MRHILCKVRSSSASFPSKNHQTANLHVKIISEHILVSDDSQESNNTAPVSTKGWRSTLKYRRMINKSPLIPI